MRMLRLVQRPNAKKKENKKKKKSKRTKLSGGKKTSAITRLVSSRSSEIISADGNCRTITRYTIARQTKTLLPANNPERDRCKRLDRSYDVRTKRTANRENRGSHGITNIEGIARAPSVSVCIAWNHVAYSSCVCTDAAADSVLYSERASART